MTEPEQSVTAESDATVGIVPGNPPELGDGVVEALEPKLQTFDEMLPATRAFYRKS